MFELQKCDNNTLSFLYTKHDGTQGDLAIRTVFSRTVKTLTIPIISAYTQGRFNPMCGP